MSTTKVNADVLDLTDDYAFTGTVTGAGGGKVGQVISTHLAGVASTTSTSLADISGFTASITPVATNSKILVILSMYSSQAAGNTTFLSMTRDSTIIAGDSVNSEWGYITATASAIDYVGNTYLDSPAKNTECVYKIQWKVDGGTVYTNRGGGATGRGGTSSITLVEILA